MKEHSCRPIDHNIPNQSDPWTCQPRSSSQSKHWMPIITQAIRISSHVPLLRSSNGEGYIVTMWRSRSRLTRLRACAGSSYTPPERLWSDAQTALCSCLSARVGLHHPLSQRCKWYYITRSTLGRLWDYSRWWKRSRRRQSFIHARLVMGTSSIATGAELS